MNRKTFLALIIVAITFAIPRTILAQIILNVPPDPAPSLLTNAELLNLLPGGRLGDEFLVGEDAVLNVMGGVVGDDLRALPASTVNIKSGSVGNGFLSQPNTTVTISGGRLGDDAVIGGDFTIAGGTIGNSFAANSGTITIAGGHFGGGFTARQGATVHMTGGVAEFDFYAHTLHMRGGTLHEISAENATFYGADFRLNGNLVAGLDEPGDRVQIEVYDGALFSGILTDGTPFVFSFFDGRDEFYGPVHLVREEVSPAPNVVNVPHDDSPLGIHSGQTLNLHPGGSLGDHFIAGEGSVVNVYGGTAGSDFEAIGAAVNVYGGRIGGRLDSFDLFRGAILNISGGFIDSGARAHGGATVHMTGGRIGDGFSASGTTMTISGGQVGRGFLAELSTNLNISGGSFGDTFRLYSRSTDPANKTFHGTDFRLNGVPVEGFAQPGDVVDLTIPEGATFSGILADGTPFVFDSDDGDEFHGPLRLMAATLAPAPSNINVPSDAPPLGVRSGQTLNLHPGGSLGDDFTAAAGSVVNITGGTVGENFKAIGADVNIRGGTLGSEFDAFAGSTINISGGTFGSAFEAYPESTIVVEGTHFTLDGIVFADLDDPGESVVIDVRGNRRVRATLLDGSQFNLLLEPRPDHLAFGHDYVDPTATLRLVVAGPEIPEPSTFVLCGLMGAVMGIGARWMLAAHM